MQIPTFPVLLVVTLASVALATVDDQPPCNATAIFTAPNELTLGKPFLATCNVSLSPEHLEFFVTYYVNDAPLGAYSVASNGSITWKTLNLHSAINLFHRLAHLKHPHYEVLFQPTSTTFSGNLRCSITVQVPTGGLATYYSKLFDSQDVSIRPPPIPPTVSVVYTNEPAVTEIKIGQPFIGRCHIDISPGITNYKVTFIFDERTFMWYTVQGHPSQPTVYWKNSSSGSAFVNIFRGNASYPNFTIQYVPTYNLTINTRFQCSVDVEVPFSGTASYNSKTVCTMSKYCD